MLMTDSAIIKWKILIKDLNLNEDETHLRLAIKGGGCSGFIKELDYCQTKDIGDKDMIEEFSDVKVVVDMKSMMFLTDAIIDYKDGLMGAGFFIDIPSAKNSCGCGDSFSM
jgi:iron-sulfur cluster assembly protein